MAIGPDPRLGFVALSRFGYGARGLTGDLAASAADPRGRLQAELERPAVALMEASDLRNSRDCLQALFDERQRIRAERQDENAAAAARGPGEATMAEGVRQAPLGADTGSPPSAKPKRAEPPVPQQLFRAEALARFRKVAEAETGYVERLVQFWSNHFCVSALKGGQVRATAGSFEREAIRPYVLGRFGDMLKAVAQHPAMLFFLDNAQSFGPSSRAGQNRKRGLNENLAREILELHTLGVHGGYTQSDVTSMAQMLTGWTFAGAQGQLGEPGVFTFFDRGHEPGNRTLLGKVYQAGGVEQGEAALADLARHPATARHIALKLAQHFVADIPPPALVDRLELTFRSSDGDLKATARALIDADESWSAETAKARSPYEFLMSAMRTVGYVPQDERLLLAPLTVMGMPLWQPPGPNGWPDTTAAWITAKGMKSRLDVSAAIAARLKERVDPKELLEACFGPTASAETRQAVARAESRQQGLAVLLMSPEFQWR